MKHPHSPPPPGNRARLAQSFRQQPPRVLLSLKQPLASRRVPRPDGYSTSLRFGKACGHLRRLGRRPNSSSAHLGLLTSFLPFELPALLHGVVRTGYNFPFICATWAPPKESQ
jgi:hypothetical protein